MVGQWELVGIVAVGKHREMVVAPTEPAPETVAVWDSVTTRRSVHAAAWSAAGVG